MGRAANLTLAAACLCTAAACATLPDTQRIIARHAGQTANFDNARGPLSREKSAAILAGLKARSGNIDILDKQLALEQAIAGSPLTIGNKVTLLKDGAATYPAMFAAIRNARHHIHVESYIIEDDALGREFSEHLLAQQARGVQVRILYDSFGSLNTPKAFFERLQAGGIEVIEFNPFNPLAARGNWSPNHRDHRKLMIVDGRIAFIGGINISSVYSSGSVIRRKPKPTTNHIEWRDTDLQLEGPVVAELQKLFLESRQKQGGEALPTADNANLFPPLGAPGKDIVRAIGSTPDDPYSLIYLTLISAIGNAEREVHLTQAYFVPDVQLLAALIDAARRGVDVKLILPSHTDSTLTFHAGRGHYTTLLDAGVKIYERRGALLHAKTIMVDGVWSSVGSTNLDWRSFIDNDEVNAVVIGRDFAAQMSAMFAADLAASDAIEPAAWKQRSLRLRLHEWMASWWQRLL